MLNYIKSRFSILLKFSMIFSLLIMMFMTMEATPTEAASWKELDKTWKYRVDPPLSDGGKENDYHVHVKGKVGSKVIEGSETVNGDESHKTTLTKSGVPKWVQDKVKGTAEFKKGKTKQKELEKARAEAKKFSWTDLLFDPKPIIDIAVVIGVSFYAFSMDAWKGLIFG